MDDPLHKADPLYVSTDIPCPQCKYNLRGLPMGRTVRCPECGVVIDTVSFRQTAANIIDLEAKLLEAPFAEAFVYLSLVLAFVAAGAAALAMAMANGTVLAIVGIAGVYALLAGVSAVALRQALSKAIAVGRDRAEGIRLVVQLVWVTGLLTVALLGAIAVVVGVFALSEWLFVLGGAAQIGWVGGVVLWRGFHEQLCLVVLHRTGTLSASADADQTAGPPGPSGD